MILLVAKDDNLWIRREDLGLLEKVEELGMELLAFEKDPAAAEMDCTDPNPEMILLSSEQATLDFCKEHFIPHVAVEMEDCLAIEDGCLDVKVENRLSADYICLGLEGLSADYLRKVYCRQTGQPVTALETKRCILREIQLTDLDRLYEIYGEASMKRFMEPLFERAEEEAYTKAYLENIYPFYDFGMWIAELKNGPIIGRVGCDPRVFDRDEMEAELGFMISEEYQGQGLAEELCRATIDYMKENTALDRMHCLIDKENDKSISLAKKLGFAHYGQRKTEAGDLLEWYIKNLR